MPTRPRNRLMDGTDSSHTSSTRMYQKTIVFFIAALAALGTLGGCLVLAGSGFTASGKRGDWQVFVPAPQAYIMAAILFALAGLALLWLVQQFRLRTAGCMLGAVAYAGLVLLATRALKQGFF